MPETAQLDPADVFLASKGAQAQQGDGVDPADAFLAASKPSAAPAAQAPGPPDFAAAHPILSKLADMAGSYGGRPGYFNLSGPKAAVNAVGAGIGKAADAYGAAADKVFTPPPVPESVKEKYPKASAAVEALGNMSADWMKRMVLAKDPLAGAGQAADVVGGAALDQINKIPEMQTVGSGAGQDVISVAQKALKPALQSLVGAGQMTADVAEGLTSRENLALMASIAAAPEAGVPLLVKRLASLGFSKGMVDAASDDIVKGYKSYLNNDTAGMVRHWGSGVVNAIFATGAAQHGLDTEIPKATPEKLRVTPEEAAAPQQPGTAPAIPAGEEKLLVPPEAKAKKAPEPQLHEGDALPAAMMADAKQRAAIDKNLNSRGLAVDESGRVSKPDDLDMVRAASAAQGTDAAVDHYKKITADPATAEKAYDSLPDAQGGRVIAADTAKELLPQWTNKDDRADLDPKIHADASRIAYEIFNRKLENVGPGDTVSLVTGPVAAGKSSFLHGGTADLSYEVNLSDETRASQHIDRILARGATPEIDYVFNTPEGSVRRRAMRMMRDGRPVAIDRSVAQHIELPNTLEKLVNKYGDKIKLNVYDNSAGNAVKVPVTDLAGMKYTKGRNELLREQQAELDRLYRDGDIPKKVHQALSRGAEQGGAAIAAPSSGRGPGVRTPEQRPVQKPAVKIAPADSSLFSLKTGLPVEQFHKVVNHLYDKYIGGPLARLVVGKETTKRLALEKHDPELANHLMQMDNAPKYLRAKSGEIVKKVVGDLSPEQERLFVLMADKASRENLQTAHPAEYAQAVNDPQIQAAIQRYRPYEQQLTELTKELGGHVLDDDHLRRVFEEHAGPGKEQAFSALDRVITPQKARNFSREQSAESYYQNGLHSFAASFAPKYESTNLALLKNKIVSEFASKATAVDYAKGDRLPPFIEYNGKKLYSHDAADQIEAETGKKVSQAQRYAVYDPTKGKKFESTEVRLLGPKSAVDALNGLENRDQGGDSSLRRFFQQQIVSLGGGLPHIFNIMRRVAMTQGAHVTDPRAWAGMWKVGFGKELRQRAGAGLDDLTADKLAKLGAISVGDATEMKKYWGGNFNPGNWAKFGHDLIFDPKSFGGLGGFDQRARIWVADYLKSKNPALNDAEIAAAVNRSLGDYNRANWTDRQKALSKIMLFPGWDMSSMDYILRHPVKSALAPAFVTLIANQALNYIGANKDEDKNDLTAVHVGDRSVTSNLTGESMARHVGSPVYQYLQGKLDNKSDSRALAEASSTRSSVGRGLLNLLRPDIGFAIGMATNKGRQGDIVKKGDELKPSASGVGNKAIDDRVIFALQQALPLVGSWFDNHGKLDVAQLVGRNFGVSNYSTDAEQKARQNSGAAYESQQALAEQLKKNPAGANEIIQRDPDGAVLAAFAPAYRSQVAQFNEIQRAREYVATAQVPAEAKKKAKLALDTAYQQELKLAAALNDALQKAKVQLRQKYASPSTPIDVLRSRAQVHAPTA